MSVAIEKAFSKPHNISCWLYTLAILWNEWVVGIPPRLGFKQFSLSHIRPSCLILPFTEKAYQTIYNHATVPFKFPIQVRLRFRYFCLSTTWFFLPGKKFVSTMAQLWADCSNRWAMGPCAEYCNISARGCEGEIMRISPSLFCISFQASIGESTCFHARFY